MRSSNKKKSDVSSTLKELLEFVKTALLHHVKNNRDQIRDQIREELQKHNQNKNKEDIDEDIDKLVEEEYLRYYMFYLYFHTALGNIDGTDVNNIKQTAIKSFNDSIDNDLKNNLQKRMEAINKNFDRDTMLKCVNKCLKDNHYGEIKSEQTKLSIKNEQHPFVMDAELKRILLKSFDICDHIDNVYETLISENTSEDSLKLKFESFSPEYKGIVIENILEIKKCIKSYRELKSKENTIKEYHLGDTINDISVINFIRNWQTNKGDNKNKFFACERNYTDLKEDLNGSVRIYVKVRKSDNSSSSIDPFQVIGGEYIKLNYINQDITNLFTYLKIQNSNLQQELISQNRKNFYGVFLDTNHQLFVGKDKTVYQELPKNSPKIENIEEGYQSNGLYNAFQQLKSGYSIVIFGYGLSGSGKTYTLLGNNNVPGILDYGLANIGVEYENINVISIFEQYYDINEFKTVSESKKEKKIKDPKMMTKIITHVGDIDERMIKYYTGLREELKQKNNEYNNREIELNNKDDNDKKKKLDDIKALREENNIHIKNYSEIIPILELSQKEKEKETNYAINISYTDLSKKLTEINQIRTNNNRIKETVNNPESSRSHLFIIIEVKFHNNIKGYVTIIDMGGRENPFEIVKSYFRKSTKGYTLPILFKTILQPVANDYSNAMFYLKDNELDKLIETISRSSGIPSALNDLRTINNARKNTKINGTYIYNNSLNKIMKELNYIYTEDELIEELDKHKYIKSGETSRNFNPFASNKVVKDRINEIGSILCDGFYINETINHLIYYFRKKSTGKGEYKPQKEETESPTQRINKNVFGNNVLSITYEVDRCFYNPRTEYSNIMTIPILQFLDLGLTDKKKPTKFIGLVCIRQEKFYVPDSLLSLDFASKISSAN
jgi:hypothetical protein